jgi:hypothetical protein
LNREEATSLLREIYASCHLGEHHIILMPPNADDVISKGYQLHIKFQLSKEDVDCIKPIVESRNLAIKDEPEKQLLVIYKPMTDKS